MRVNLLAAVIAVALPALAAAQAPDATPLPAATPAASPAGTPEAAATAAATGTPSPAPASGEDAPLLEGPTRISFEDGLRDGSLDGERASLFGAKIPDPTVTTTPEYGRGYKQSFVSTLHHRRANTAVVGGFVVVILALGATAWAQSQSGSGGAIQPAGPALFRF